MVCESTQPRYKHPTAKTNGMGNSHIDGPLVESSKGSFGSGGGGLTAEGKQQLCFVLGKAEALASSANSLQRFKELRAHHFQKTPLQLWLSPPAKRLKKAG